MWTHTPTGRFLEFILCQICGHMLIFVLSNLHIRNETVEGFGEGPSVLVDGLPEHLSWLHGGRLDGGLN